jgi:hypothetical protein
LGRKPQMGFAFRRDWIEGLKGLDRRPQRGLVLCRRCFVYREGIPEGLGPLQGGLVLRLVRESIPGCVWISRHTPSKCTSRACF